MQEFTNHSKLEKLFKENGGSLKREQVDQAGIPSWFFSDFVKRHGLVKIAPGFYANEDYAIDGYAILQERYPKYVFSYLSALYLLGLTDKVPTVMEVTGPQGYNPSRTKGNDLVIHRISNPEIYQLGIAEVKTMFGNVVRVYDPERTVCDLIKHRDSIDGETFIKALRCYVRVWNDQARLFRYARTLKIEKQVFEVMEIVSNED